MNDLVAYLWATPNSRRVSILLEELELPYTVVPVNIRAGEQFAPSILALNPFGKLPILSWESDSTACTLTESGAILLFFAEHFQQLIPLRESERRTMLQWLMTILTGLGPAMGQAHHWLHLSQHRHADAISHAQAAVHRIYTLLERQLSEQTFLSGDYSIVDIAAYPWIERHGWTGLGLARYPALEAWAGRIADRP
ncbi:MAG: glutathione S-transferase family protein, partial [Haliea sp.]